jgi:hypothetical protein
MSERPKNLPLLSRLKTIHWPAWVKKVPWPAWAAIGVLVAIIIVAAFLLLRPASDFMTLTVHPAILHPDGMVLRLAEDVGSVDVRLQAIPREVFWSGQAGWQWNHPLEVWPDDLTPVGPLFIMERHGEGRIIAEMSVPNNAEPLETLDLYRWDEENDRWAFVPSTLDVVRNVIIFEPTVWPMAVIAVQVEAPTPVVAMASETEDVPEAAPYEVFLPMGMTLNADGTLGGDLTGFTAEGGLIYPVFSGEAPADPNAVLENLASFAASYDGLAFDLAPGAARAPFIAAVCERLHADGMNVSVILRGLPADGEELRALAGAADFIWLAPGGSPTLYLSHGEAAAALDAVVANVDRHRVGLLVSAESVDVSDGAAVEASMEEALAPFGEVTPVSGYHADTPLWPGNQFAMRLDSRVESMGYDEALGVDYLTYSDDERQEHYVYFASGAGLLNQLRWASRYSLAGIAVENPGDAEVMEGLTAFLEGGETNAPPPLQIIWRVSHANGDVVEEVVSESAGDLTALQYMWVVPETPGSYWIDVLAGQEAALSSRGRIVLEVSESGAPTPTPTPTPTATPEATETAEGESSQASAPAPAPVAAAGAWGNFELGGQVAGGISHPDDMRRAGMTWAKMQVQWWPGMSPSEAAPGIQEAHAMGFRVLLSICGGPNPDSIDYAAYADFVGGVAALGPDAIEVWNEENIDRQWPTGQISATDYVNRMLAPAFNAIRAANPNVMVISGAPSPTGYFGGCAAQGCDDWLYVQQMAAAGAARYADCIGVHFNSGATSPYAESGHPGGDHYSWYYPGMVRIYSGFGRPLCWTELGYVTGEGLGELPGGWAWGRDNTLGEQAQWLAEAAQIGRSSGNTRLMIIWNVDFTHWGDDPQAGYAIIRPGGGCPACDALAAVMAP